MPGKVRLKSTKPTSESNPHAREFFEFKVGELVEGEVKHIHREGALLDIGAVKYAWLAFQEEKEGQTIAVGDNLKRLPATGFDPPRKRVLVGWPGQRRANKNDEGEDAFRQVQTKKKRSRSSKAPPSTEFERQEADGRRPACRRDYDERRLRHFPQTLVPPPPPPPVDAEASHRSAHEHLQSTCAVTTSDTESSRRPGRANSRPIRGRSSRELSCVSDSELPRTTRSGSPHSPGAHSAERMLGWWREEKGALQLVRGSAGLKNRSWCRADAGLEGAQRAVSAGSTLVAPAATLADSSGSEDDHQEWASGPMVLELARELEAKAHHKDGGFLAVLPNAGIQSRPPGTWKEHVRPELAPQCLLQPIRPCPQAIQMKPCDLKCATGGEHNFQKSINFLAGCAQQEGNVALPLHEAILQEQNIEEHAVRKFRLLPSHMQAMVMDAGDFANARDPTAVLMARMRKVMNGEQLKFMQAPTEARASLPGVIQEAPRVFELELVTPPPGLHMPPPPPPPPPPGLGRLSSPSPVRLQEPPGLEDCRKDAASREDDHEPRRMRRVNRFVRNRLQTQPTEEANVPDAAALPAANAPHNAVDCIARGTSNAGADRTLVASVTPEPTPTPIAGERTKSPAYGSPRSVAEAASQNETHQREVPHGKSRGRRHKRRIWASSCSAGVRVRQNKFLNTAHLLDADAMPPSMGLGFCSEIVSRSAWPANGRPRRRLLSDAN